MKQKMFFGALNFIFKNAKELRSRMTPAEQLLWQHLRQSPKGFKFRRQHPLGFYIVDFYCHKAKLVIELDGSIHEENDVKKNDIIRQKIIEEKGLDVVRFTNNDVFHNMSNVLGENRHLSYHCCKPI